MQRIVGNTVRLDEFQYLFTRPIKQWVGFDQPSMFVERRRRKLGAFDRLVGAHAGDPSRAAFENSREWRHLTHSATLKPICDGRAKTVDALLCDQPLDAAAFRSKDGNSDAVAMLSPRPDIVSFRKKASGIERGDVNREPLREYRMS